MGLQVYRASKLEAVCMGVGTVFANMDMALFGQCHVLAECPAARLSALISSANVNYKVYMWETLVMLASFSLHLHAV